MQYCHLASTKYDEIFLSLKHPTSAQAQVSFTWALGATGYHWDSEVAWLSESCLLPQKAPGETHPEAGGVTFARSVILMAVVLAPKGSWSHGAVSESRWPTAKGRQDKPPHTPNCRSEQHFSRKDENIPCQWPSPGPSPFFALPTVLPRLDPGQNSHNKVTVRLLKVPKRWQEFCFLAFSATLQMECCTPKYFQSLFLGEIPSSLHLPRHLKRDQQTASIV